MSARVDRKVVEVPVAEYRYRHEAEFAAGFLEDAGIPFRLQIDDAGGADLGLSMLRPSVIWVRAVDLDDAREVLGLEEVDGEAKSAPPPTVAPEDSRREAEGSRLGAQERVISASLSVALFAAVPYLPYGPYRTWAGVVCLAGALGFLVATAVGRAPRPFEQVVRMLSGSLPE